tara:strand:- start:10999 stop:11247 length:249 start_codon:yes stop_codon:yes gene_type:complete
MQVEYMNKSIAEADWKELEELVAPLHKSGAKHYTKLVKHPTEELWAMAITMVIGYKDIVGDWINKKGLILTQYSSDWSTITK